jgi:hypothetical protein
MVDPAAIASALPDRPVQADPLETVADGIDASLLTVPQETAAGVEIVRMAFLFVPDDADDDTDDPSGDAVGLRFDSGEWHGEIQRRDVTLSQWLRVNEIWAESMTHDLKLQQMQFEEHEREF